MMCKVLLLVKNSYPQLYERVARYAAAARLLGVCAYGSPPPAGSAHWTIPRLPKSSMCLSSYPISRSRGLVCWPIWAEAR